MGNQYRSPYKFMDHHNLREHFSIPTGVYELYREHLSIPTNLSMTTTTM